MDLNVNWKALLFAVLVTLAIASSNAHAQDCTQLEYEVNDLQSQLRAMQLDQRAQYISLNQSLNKILDKPPEVSRTDIFEAENRLGNFVERQTAPERFVAPFFFVFVLGFASCACLMLYWKK